MELHLPNRFTPRPYQRRPMAYLDSGGKRAVCIWHRRAGKDLTFLHQTAKMAHERRGVYWHSLPTYRQAKKAIWDGFTRTGEKILPLVFPPSIVKAKNESEMQIELKCGSLIQLVGSDTIDNLVGAGPVHVTFSEYALCKPTAWGLVRPMLRENDGSAAFITTPRGKNHAFTLYEMARQNPKWFCERLNIYESGAFEDPQAVLDEERAEGMEEALISSEYLVDFDAPIVGSVWGELLAGLVRSGATAPFEHERDGIFTSWDLGLSDATAIWFWRIAEGGVDFVDHYENHNKPMSHFFDVLDERAEKMGYKYVKHWLPHDARAKTLQTGESIVEQCAERWGSGLLAIAPKLSPMDGIQAGRWLLQKRVRFHPRANDGLEALKQYHYEYDEDTKTFGRNPEHDWSSHTADAFRYAAVVYRYSDLATRKPVPKPPPARPVPGSYFQDNPEELFRRGAA